MTTQKPNILIYNLDEMRADTLHHLGNPAAVTPNFDQFLKDAVSFRNAFCQNPVCVPSRCSFLTGLYPHVRGHRTMHHMLHEDEPVLFKYLRDHGYYVWLNLRNDFLPAQFKNYYSEIADEVMGIKIRHRGRKLRWGNKRWANRVKETISNIIKKAEKPSKDIQNDEYYSFLEGKIEEKKNGLDIFRLDEVSVNLAKKFIHKRPKKKQFCVFLGLIAPHPPYAIEEPYYSMIDRKKLPPRIPYPEHAEKKPSMIRGLREHQHLQSWPEERWDELRAVYLGMVTKVDHLFGELIQTLKDMGEYDNTAIFVFSDHGDFAGDYGIAEKNQNTFEDCLVNVPLMIKPPKGYDIDPGIRDSLVELIDFYATVEEYAGFKSGHSHFGKSLQPIIADSSISDHRYAVFCEGGRLKNETQCMELESDLELNPSNQYYPRLKLQRSKGPEHTKATMIRTSRYKYVKRFYELDELYDLQTDPQELDNRINDPSLKEILHDLQNKMLNHYQETSDVVPMTSDERMGRFDLRVFLRVALQLRKMKKERLRLSKKETSNRIS